MKATEMLKQEHRAIERILTVLETAVRRLEDGQNVSPRLIRDAISFIQNFADKCHHGKEEDILFTAMEQKGFPRNFGPLAVMLFEHDEGRAHVQGMLAAVKALDAGKPNSLQELAFHAHAFARLLREHIMKEDNVLFVMADQQFSESEQQRLSDEFQRAEATGAACMQKSALLELLERLERDIQQVDVLSH